MTRLDPNARICYNCHHLRLKHTLSGGNCKVDDMRIKSASGTCGDFHKHEGQRMVYRRRLDGGYDVLRIEEVTP